MIYLFSERFLRICEQFYLSLARDTGNLALHLPPTTFQSKSRVVTVKLFNNSVTEAVLWRVITPWRLNASMLQLYFFGKIRWQSYTPRTLSFVVCATDIKSEWYASKDKRDHAHSNRNNPNKTVTGMAEMASHKVDHASLS